MALRVTRAVAQRTEPTDLSRVAMQTERYPFAFLQYNSASPHSNRSGERTELTLEFQFSGRPCVWTASTRHHRPGDVPLPALLVEGLHHGGGEPFALEHRLIALAEVPAAERESFTGEAPGTWLLHHVPWTAARHRIRAVEATTAEAKALALRPRGACLELERTTWRAGKIVTRVRQLFRGDRYDLVAEFRP